MIHKKLQLVMQEDKADLSDLIDNSNWKIVDNTAERIEKFYDCCPEPYISLSYNITVQRKGIE